jgi:hypothetical protein
MIGRVGTVNSKSSNFSWTMAMMEMPPTLAMIFTWVAVPLSIAVAADSVAVAVAVADFLLSRGADIEQRCLQHGRASFHTTSWCSHSTPQHDDQWIFQKEFAMLMDDK